MLTAARELFAERGYSAVTMDDVAAAAGITKPLLYNYFGNKERLYLACMQPAGEALVATVVRAVAGTTNAAEALDAGLRSFFAFLAEDRAAWRVLFDETLPRGGEVAERIGEYRERIHAARRRDAPRPASGVPQGEGEHRGECDLDRRAGCRRGARPLVASDRRDLRGRGRADAHRHARAGSARARRARWRGAARA